MSFKNFLNYVPAIIPPTDKEEMKRLMIKYHKDKWADDDGKFTRSTEEITDELIAMGKKGYIILGHETIHALQKKLAPQLLKGSSDLGDDITADKVKYLSLPSEIMAFAYTNVMGDKKNESMYRNIGGDVYKLYMKYIEEYKNKL